MKSAQVAQFGFFILGRTGKILKVFFKMMLNFVNWDADFFHH